MTINTNRPLLASASPMPQWLNRVVANCLGVSGT